MVWNKDLAKLKQELKTEEGTEPKRPVPKPSPKPAAPKELEDEDALFLAAMGKRRKLTPLAEDLVSPPEAPAPVQSVPEKADFREAMASLKGVKPVQAPKALPPETRPTESQPAIPATPPEESMPSLTPVPETTAKHEPESARSAPVLIQLAAGMAIEVDGTLDLRGHAPVDAIERLKERILDGHLLGWRTFHIQLGSSEELRQAFQRFLVSPDADLIARYAQAPIPMGGAQAWILYLGIQGSSTH